MIEVPEFRVYISSTIDDLVEERKAAIKIIRDIAVVKESYRVSEQGTVATCTEDVRNAHLYVGIIGHRYGWVPDGKDKSITELEYEACESRLPKIPRFIFLRTDSDDRYRDSKHKPATAERIESFRSRLEKGEDQMACVIDKEGEWKIKLSQGVQRKKEEFVRDWAPGTPTFDLDKHWTSALHTVVLLAARGTDDDLAALIAETDKKHFFSALISPLTPNTAVELENGLQRAQLGCLIVTHESLPRMSDAASSGRFDRVLETLRRRSEGAAILCVDVDPSNLPSSWSKLATVVVVAQSKNLNANPAAEVARLYSELKGAALRGLTTAPRLALPYLVIAPTAPEVQALSKEDGSGFAAFKGSRRSREKQFRQLTKEARKVHRNGWPDGCYGTDRVEWRCFGFRSPLSLTVAKLIEDVVSKINTTSAGSHERRLLQKAEILARQYSLDEFLNDIDGSRRMIEAVRDRGCLIVIDETSLLHKVLRDAAIELLAMHKGAVVSISPCDPAYLATDQLLDEERFLYVSSILARFKTEQDPQCELALNSEQRVRRWLRIAIPSLLVERDGLSQPQSQLVARSAELWS